MKRESLINLETSLRVGDEISGHLVFGHIDIKTKLISKKYEGSSMILKIKLPFELKSFIAPKGSIAINGVSLTVNDVSSNSFEVNIIPHTLKNTTFNQIGNNELLNLEIDMLARYVSNYDTRGLYNKVREYIRHLQYFILWHYQFGSKYDTPFWNYAKSLRFIDPKFDGILRKSRKMGWDEIKLDGERNDVPTYAQWNPYAFKLWYEGMTKKEK